jgi:serine/threonine protein kinase
MAGLEEVRQIGSSFFGVVRLVRRAKAGGGFDYFAAKYYDVGDNREGIFNFHDRMRGFLDLCHPHVMPLIGVVDPVGQSGPILLTEYSEQGSLEDVLERVRRNDPPPFWNDATKLRMIVSLITGLNYLHNHGIVHRELKPTDLIVESDGSLRVCGYATSVLEEHRFTRATQVGGPSYMAPEIYDDEHDGQRLRDPKTDVFSFGLIIYELLCGQKIFPSTMSAATIMRRAMSTRASDRPMIPDSLHPILRELMSRSWIPTATKRPSIETLWKRMRGARFKLFPTVDAVFIPLNSDSAYSPLKEPKASS